MTDEKRRQDGGGVDPLPREGDVVRPETPAESDFFDHDEHDGWAPIRRRAVEPEPAG